MAERVTEIGSAKATGRRRAEAGLLGYRFRDPKLLERALTHRSLAFEAAGAAAAPPVGIPGSPQSDNEQLEFLGDAVLGMVIAESLYRRFPGSREGELTRLRASIVSRKHLGEVAARIGLGDHLRLGKGEERSGGRRKPALLSNALEAVIAAVYLDGGLAAAEALIEREIVTPALPALAAAVDTGPGVSGTFSGAVGDHKSALQELLQATGTAQAQYVLTDQSGPDHRKQFSIEVQVTDEAGKMSVLGAATAGTKKAAQQEAARLALTGLSDSATALELPGDRDA